MRIRPIHRKEVLNEQFIHSLKTLITEKHATAAPPERAAILANAVHRALDSRIPDFPKEEKVTLRFRLLEQARLQGQFRITTDDVLRACLKQEMTDSSQLEPLRLWAEQELGEPLPVEPFVTALTSLIEQQHGSDLKLELLRERVADYQVEVAAAAETVELDRLQPVWYHVAVPGHARWAAALLFLMLWFTMGWTQPQSGDTAGTNALTVTSIELLESVMLNRTAQAAGDEVPEAPIWMGDYTVPYPGVYNELPFAYQYHDIHTDTLKKYLNERKSLLVDEPYFSTLLTTAEKFNLHPLLLFAITGQEQSFVPRDEPGALKIANNPFNVYHSWQEYNTTIEDSARIAAKTVVNLSKDRPEDVHAIQWINRKYAEDPNWWVGVSRLFNMLLEQQMRVDPS